MGKGLKERMNLFIISSKAISHNVKQFHLNSRHNNTSLPAPLNAFWDYLTGVDSVSQVNSRTLLQGRTGGE